MSIRGVYGLRGCAAGMVQSGSVCISPADVAASQAAQASAAVAAALANANNAAIAAGNPAQAFFPTIPPPVSPAIASAIAAPTAPAVSFTSELSAIPTWGYVAAGLAGFWLVFRK